MKNREEKIKFIQGFIDFCNADLENLTITEKAFWARNISTILGFKDGELFYSVSEAGEVTEREWESIKDLQNEVNEGLYWLFKYLKKKELYLQINAPRGFFSEDTFYFGDSEDCGEPVIIKIYRRFEHSFTDSTVLETKRVHLCFEFFLKTLSDFPTASLLKCPICKNIYFNPTKREKIYCSSRCQNTAAVRRLRAMKQNEKGGS